MVGTIFSIVCLVVTVCTLSYVSYTLYKINLDLKTKEILLEQAEKEVLDSKNTIEALKRVSDTLHTELEELKKNR